LELTGSGAVSQSGGRWVISRIVCAPDIVLEALRPGELRQGVALKAVVELPYPEAEVEDFTIGMFVSYGDVGDAWMRAPDGGVGTHMGDRGAERFEVEIPATPDGRWGTFQVRLPLPMTTNEEAAEYLRALLPKLRTHWEAWKESRR
jgi:hypothetical protein